MAGTTQPPRRKGPSRSRAAALRRAERDAEIARLYAEGMTQDEIASRVGLHRGNVSKAIARAETSWRREATATRSRQLSVALAKVDAEERLAWREFHRSCEDEVRSEAGEGPRGPWTKTTTRTQAGSAALLGRIVGAIELRCRLLGIPLEAAPRPADDLLDAEAPADDAALAGAIEAEIERVAVQRAVTLARSAAQGAGG